MHKITAITTSEELSKVKRELMRMCVTYGVIGVVEALSEMAGDFSGEQGSLYPREEDDSTDWDKVEFGSSIRQTRGHWKAAWALLSSTAGKLEQIMKG